MKRLANEAAEIAKHFQMNAERFQSASELHSAITIQMEVFIKVLEIHRASSRNSVFFQAVILGILSSGKQGMDDIGSLFCLDWSWVRGPLKVNGKSEYLAIS